MKCHYCKREMIRPSAISVRSHPRMWTKDHVIPLSRDGPNTTSNKVDCCQKCNGMKNDMMPGEWDAFMAENPRWWEKEIVGTRWAGGRRGPAYRKWKNAQYENQVSAWMNSPRMKGATIDSSPLTRSIIAEIKPAALVCPVLQMVAEFFMRVRYPAVYRACDRILQMKDSPDGLCS